MNSGRWILTLTFLFSLLVPAWAGVVEDAEEALKNVPADSPGRAAALSGQNAGKLPPPQTSAVVSSSKSSVATSASTGRKSQSPQQSASSSGSNSGAIKAVEPPGGVEAQRERDKRAHDTSDNVLTFGVALLIIALIAAAGYLSRRLAGTSD